MHTMLKLFLVVLFSTVIKPTAGLGQEKSYRPPVYEQIEQQVLDPNSPYHYPDILQRFMAKDTTLSVDDFYYLYYGFVFQKAYQNPVEVDNAILAYLKEVQAAEFNESSYDTYIQLSKSSLRDCPINPFALNMLIYLYGLKGDESTSREWTYLSAGLTNAMFASGDGLTCETGFHIILNSHINYFMDLLEVPETLDPKFDEQFRCAEIDLMGYMSIYFNVEKVLSTYFTR